jgi:hypothetical protein
MSECAQMVGIADCTNLYVRITTFNRSLVKMDTA